MQGRITEVSNLKYKKDIQNNIENKFSKQDLQPLYVIQLRAGDYGMVIDISTGRYIQLRKKEGYIQEFLPLKDYLNDLTYIDPYDSNLDIICVWGFSLFKEEALTISTEARPLLWAA